MARAVPAFDAVVFDLFGTLVRFSFPQYDVTVRGIAAVLGAPPDRYAAAVDEGYYDVETGSITVETLLATAAERTGAPVQRAALAQAVGRWHAFQATQLEPWHDAATTLRHLRSARIPVGLVSNAPPPVHELWPGSTLARWVDATAFSYVVGTRKPAARMYLGVCEALGAPPSRCLYIGDGSSRELHGAQDAGLTPVLIRRPDDPPENDLRFGRHPWDGAMVPTLTALTTHLARG